MKPLHLLPLPCLVLAAASAQQEPAAPRPATTPAVAPAAVRAPAAAPKATAPPQQPAVETPCALLTEPMDLLQLGLDHWYFDRPGIATDKVARLENGVLHLSGTPTGCLITKRWFRDYEIEVEWRWPGKPGNGGVLPHARTPDQIGCWPRAMECQLLFGDVGEFLAIPRQLPFTSSPNPNQSGVARRAPEVKENPPGEWSNMKVRCKGRDLEIFVNGVRANRCTGWPDSEGPLALQNEGTPIDFRKVVVRPLAKE
jgi:3-keto-disaccharide hydrolase